VEEEQNIIIPADRRSSSWDISNAPKNYLSLLLTQGGSAFFSFVAVWLITHYLGSEGYGAIIAVIAASQVAQVLVNWTSVAVARFGVDEFVETGKIARTFWLRSLILIPNLALVLLASRLWFPFLAEWLRLPLETFWLVVLHFAVSAIWLHVQFSLQGAKMLRVQGLLQMVERVLIVTGLLSLLAAGKLAFIPALLCYIASSAVMIVVGLFLLRRFIFSSFSIDGSFIKKILVYSLPLLPFTLVGYFSGSYVDAVFISKFLSTRELGIYSVATQVNGIAMQFPTLANTLLLPLFVTLQKEDQGHRTGRYFNDLLPSMTLAWGMFCAVLAFISYFLIPAVFGAEFTVSVIVLWILLAASTVSFPVLVGYSALSNAASATHIAMFAAIFSALANILFNFLLIPSLGMPGCAWATFLAYFVSMMVFALLLRRSGKIRLKGVVPAMLPILGSALCFYLTGNAWLSLLICAVAAFLVAYLQKDSLRESFYLLKNFRRT
jgi:O-antigen/teichoic acid export membrane protein